MLPAGFRTDRVEPIAYPDFGVYVLRSSGFYCCIRCGPRYPRGIGSHRHNDQLSVELVVGGEDVALDPGSYLYTPLPARRDAYRCVAAHLAPHAGVREPGELGAGLFILRDRCEARCLYFGPEGFAGLHDGYGAPVRRLLRFENAELRIVDSSEHVPLTRCPFAAGADGVSRFVAPPFSDGYGRRLRC